MRRIFFVDDEPIILQAFMSLPIFLECGFVNAGHSVNSIEAVGKIKEINPDAVFTDLKMPGLNGVEMMGKLKNEGYNGEFVIISAYTDFEESRRFFKMSGFDYLIKPVGEHELQDVLLSLSEKLICKNTGESENFTMTPSPLLDSIIAYLHNSTGEKHTLETISVKFGLNQNYICKLFSRYMNMTFVSYLKKIRMEQAAVLLKTTRTAIKEIAKICGYHDYFYFCRIFRDVYDCTPSEYRGSPQ